MPDPLITPRAEITEAIVNAAAQASGLHPEQITAIDIDHAFVNITYNGASPGMHGAPGRSALRTYNTETGRLIDDNEIRP